MDFLDSNIDQIKNLCGKYNVRRLFAFGSVLTDKFIVVNHLPLLKAEVQELPEK